MGENVPYTSYLNLEEHAFIKKMQLLRRKCKGLKKILHITPFWYNFSKPRPIILTNVSLDMLESLDQSLPSISNENVDLICISSRGNLHMKNMTPLPFLLAVLHYSAAFALICDSQQYSLYGVIFRHFRDFWIQTWPNLDEMVQGPCAHLQLHERSRL
jgi:hypothetical protein